MNDDTRRYELQDLNEYAEPEGEPIVMVDLDEFLSVNADWLDDDPEERERIMNLKPGEEYTGGGGAAQGFVLRRVR